MHPKAISPCQEKFKSKPKTLKLKSKIKCHILNLFKKNFTSSKRNKINIENQLKSLNSLKTCLLFKKNKNKNTLIHFKNHNRKCKK